MKYIFYLERLWVYSFMVCFVANALLMFRNERVINVSRRRSATIIIPIEMYKNFSFFFIRRLSNPLILLYTKCNFKLNHLLQSIYLMTLNDGYLSISHEIEQRAETEFRKRKLTLGLRFPMYWCALYSYEFSCG